MGLLSPNAHEAAVRLVEIYVGKVSYSLAHRDVLFSFIPVLLSIYYNLMSLEHCAVLIYGESDECDWGCVREAQTVGI